MTKRAADKCKKLIEDYRIAIRELSLRLEDEILRGQECMFVLRERLNKLLANMTEPK